MIVCIAEKPSVARDIADVLGAKTKKDGYIEGNGYKLYEDEKRYYSVWMKNNIPDPTTWASLN